MGMVLKSTREKRLDGFCKSMFYKMILSWVQRLLGFGFCENLRFGAVLRPSLLGPCLGGLVLFAGCDSQEMGVLQKAQVHYQLKDWPMAVQEFRKAIQENPLDTGARYGLALSLGAWARETQDSMKCSLWDQADLSLRSVLLMQNSGDSTKQSPENVEDLDNTPKKTRIPQSWTILRARALTQRAACALDAMHLSRAQNLLDSALMQQPDFAEALDLRAFSYEIVDAEDAAILEYEHLLAVHPDYLTAYVPLARLRAQNGDTLGALDLLLNAQSRDSTLYEVQELLEELGVGGGS
jgi:tetratricopeptide (TPR) repeat protein